jgi:pyrroloquinoline quinone biosynthesis protein D
VDGARGIGGIIDILAERFAAPRGEIAADVVELVTDLAGRGVLRL